FDMRTRKECEQDYRQSFKGFPPACGTRPGAFEQPQRADFRRAYDWTRSDADNRNKTAYKGPARRADDPFEQLHFARSRPALPAGGHYQQGRDRGYRQSGQPYKPAPENGEDPFGGERSEPGA